MSDNFFTENTILVMIFFLLLVLFSFLKIGNCAYQLYSFKKSIVKGKKDILSVNQQIKLVPTDIQHTYNAITRIDNCLGIFILLVCAYNQLLIHHLFLSYIFMAIMGILACERWKFFLHLIEDGYLLIKKALVHYLYVFPSLDEQRQVLTIQKNSFFVLSSYDA